MAITATTLSAAVTATQISFGVASATGITAPNFTTGVGVTVLLVDLEYMIVTGVSGTFISVQRGQYGTAAVSHLINSQVQIGALADFLVFTEFVQRSLTAVEVIAAQNIPATFLAGTTDAIPATVPGFYVVKTAGVNAMTLAAPTAAQEGNVIWVMSDTANAHTITFTGATAANGTALKTTATFPAFRGASVQLRASNLVWHVLSAGPVATATGATGVVVFS